MKRIMTAFFLLVLLLDPVFCGGAGWFRDGTYEGEHMFVKVSVSIDDGQIADIKILYHGNGGWKYESMVEPLTHEMVERQTTRVDSVSGATVSSKFLRIAVNNALLQAAIVKERFERDFGME